MLGCGRQVDFGWFKNIYRGTYEVTSTMVKDVGACLRDLATSNKMALSGSLTTKTLETLAAECKMEKCKTVFTPGGAGSHASTVEGVAGINYMALDRPDFSVCAPQLAPSISRSLHADEQGCNEQLDTCFLTTTHKHSCSTHYRKHQKMCTRRATGLDAGGHGARWVEDLSCTVLFTAALVQHAFTYGLSSGEAEVIKRAREGYSRRSWSSEHSAEYWDDSGASLLLWWHCCARNPESLGVGSKSHMCWSKIWFVWRTWTYLESLRSADPSRWSRWTATTNWHEWNVRLGGAKTAMHIWVTDVCVDFCCFHQNVAIPPVVLGSCLVGVWVWVPCWLDVCTHGNSIHKINAFGFAMCVKWLSVCIFSFVFPWVIDTHTFWCCCSFCPCFFWCQPTQLNQFVGFTKLVRTCSRFSFCITQTSEVCDYFLWLCWNKKPSGTCSLRGYMEFSIGESIGGPESESGRFKKSLLEWTMECHPHLQCQLSYWRDFRDRVDHVVEKNFKRNWVKQPAGPLLVCLLEIHS